MGGKRTFLKFSVNLQWFGVWDFPPVKIVAWKKKDTILVLVCVVTPLTRARSPGQIPTLWAAHPLPASPVGRGSFQAPEMLPFSFFFPLWIPTANIWFLPSEPPRGWVREAWGSTGSQTGTFLSPLERSEWWSWLTPCSHQAPGGWWYSGAYVLDFKVGESCKILSSHSTSFLKWCYCWL